MASYFEKYSSIPILLVFGLFLVHTRTIRPNNDDMMKAIIIIITLLSSLVVMGCDIAYDK